MRRTARPDTPPPAARRPRHRSLRLALLAALALCLLPLGPALAQSSAVSELWREWAVLEQQWRVEKAQIEVDLRRLRARRAALQGKAAPGGDRKAERR